MAKKVYAIQYGFDLKNNKKIENLIVNTWAECLKYVKGVKGAKYKSFESLDEANKYLNEGQRMLKKSDENYPKDCLHIYVDGSYNSSSNKYSYGLVAVKNNIVEYVESGSGDSDEQNNIRQIAGELKAAVKGIEYAKSKKYSKAVIFHDYEGIAHHATGAWQRREESSKEYYEKMQELMKSGIEIIFVKVDSHTGDLFNELADEKCKECLNIPSDRVVEKYLKDNTIMVIDEETKEKLFNIGGSYSSNILIYGKENVAVNKDDESNINDKFKNILEIYNQDKEQAKKSISKMLSKEKEKFILYLLENK